MRRGNLFTYTILVILLMSTRTIIVQGAQPIQFNDSWTYIASTGDTFDESVNGMYYHDYDIQPIILAETTTDRPSPEYVLAHNFGIPSVSNGGIFQSVFLQEAGTLRLLPDGGVPVAFERKISGSILLDFGDNGSLEFPDFITDTIFSVKLTTTDGAKTTQLRNGEDKQLEVLTTFDIDKYRFGYQMTYSITNSSDHYSMVLNQATILINLNYPDPYGLIGGITFFYWNIGKNDMAIAIDDEAMEVDLDDINVSEMTQFVYNFTLPEDATLPTYIEQSQLLPSEVASQPMDQIHTHVVSYSLPKSSTSSKQPISIYPLVVGCLAITIIRRTYRVRYARITGDPK